MAGPFPGGGANRFRNGIRFAMAMAAAPDTAQRAIFRFPARLVYVNDGEDAPVDAHGVPYNPDVPVRREEPDPVIVDCAIEYFDDRGQELSGFGPVSASRIRVLLLDEEYEQVKAADRIVAGGDTYHYRRTQPPMGLFDVGIFELWFHAEQEV
jgi:hypothetical protein